MVHFFGITAIIAFALWLFISDMQKKYDNQKESDDVSAYEN